MKKELTEEFVRANAQVWWQFTYAGPQEVFVLRETQEYYILAERNNWGQEDPTYREHRSAKMGTNYDNPPFPTREEAIRHARYKLVQKVQAAEARVVGAKEELQKFNGKYPPVQVPALEYRCPLRGNCRNAYILSDDCAIASKHYFQDHGTPCPDYVKEEDHGL